MAITKIKACVLKALTKWVTGILVTNTGVMKQVAWLLEFIGLLICFYNDKLLQVTTAMIRQNKKAAGSIPGSGQIEKVWPNETSIVFERRKSGKLWKAEEGLRRLRRRQRRRKLDDETLQRRIPKQQNITKLTKVSPYLSPENCSRGDSRWH